VAAANAAGAATTPTESSYAAARQAGYALSQSPAGFAGAQSQNGFPQQPQAPVAPVPQQPAYPANYGQRYDQMPKINRAEFPVSVNPENSLRFVSTGKLMGAPSVIGRGPAVPNAGSVNEPWRGVQPLVARRVPGVGAMPYEHYGFSLLPGWTGVLTASAPHTAETAPAGTLWTTLQAKDAQSTRGGAAGIDPLRQDASALLRTIAGAPRVPSPNAVQSAPPQGRVAQVPVNMTQASVAPIMTMASLVEAAAQTLPAPKGNAGANDEGAKRAQALYKDGDYEGAIAALDMRGNAGESVDLRLVRAWSLMHLNRQEEARVIFASLDKSKTVGATGSIAGKSTVHKVAAKSLAKASIAKTSPAGNQ
jgi:hypothetical protein